MDTEDRTVIASIPFEAEEPGVPPEDRTNPTADVQILESRSMDVPPVAEAPAVGAGSRALVAPAGMAALAASQKPWLSPALWAQLREHAMRARTLATWQLALLVLGAVAFGAWLSS